MTQDVQFVPGQPQHAQALAGLLYESAHELMDFMHGSREDAEAVLRQLLRRRSGHFGYGFCTVMMSAGEVAGVELGYDRATLSAQDVPGALAMLRAARVTRWPHLVATVGRVIAAYVSPPARDAYYINNIAVGQERRGQGLGEALLLHVLERARGAGYRCVELDVTEANEGAIRFYRRHGFHAVSESGSQTFLRRYGLPRLKRMRCLLAGAGAQGVAAWHGTNVVDDVTRLNPVRVEESYAPGNTAQLQRMLRDNDRPVSIGGGRYSMGGHTAQAGTLHIDLRGMNRVLSLDADAAVIRVEAGARWRDVQRVISDYGLAVKVMQTYADFTVGGSLSVNCHGRYVGLGPIVLTVRSIALVLHDGELVQASPTHNARVFYAAIGGYGALGIIAEAELELAANTRIERLTRKLRLADYPEYFRRSVRDNRAAVFHNTDLVPPRFTRGRAITWQVTDKALTSVERPGRLRLYLAEKYMLWAITETAAGHLRREFLYEPLLYLRRKVSMRNHEADYDVAELEPLSRTRSTYVLQEYFVPVARLTDFTERLAAIFARYRVKAVNVSVRHAHADPGSWLAWAREEVFALVLYYKQGTAEHERECVAVWTRELVDAALACAGTYYLPYQPHARHDQFHAAYPRARELFTLKDELDPGYRFRNVLWEKYYRRAGEAPRFGTRATQHSEFLSVYGDTRQRDDFYRFLQTVYHLYPEDRFHALIIEACERHDSDAAIYAHVAAGVRAIKPVLSELTYALPALARQKDEMRRQTVEIVGGRRNFVGYLEIGSTGRYVKHLRKSLGIGPRVFLSNDTAPDDSPAQVMERGGLRQTGRFFPLNDYAPIPPGLIADESLDLVTCYIGLHHCPRERLAPYIASIRRVLRWGGYFVLRDHDAGSERMRNFASLVHTVFNAGLGVSWARDREELRLFEGVDFWVQALEAQGFTDTGQRLLQAHDPSLNTLMCFVKHG